MKTNHLTDKIMTVKEAFQKAKESRLERITIPTIRNIIGRELTAEDKAEIEIEKKNLKEEKRIQSEKNTEIVNRVIITINWVKNPTWGLNPNGLAEVYYADGSYAEYKYKTSGSGVNKLSHCIGGLLNKFLHRPLWEIEVEDEYMTGIILQKELGIVMWEQGSGICGIIAGLERCGYTTEHVKTKREDILYITKK